ncbi:chaplin family protein [Streptosporangium sp. CA-135522]|uniref:chaplin family protein n=1 Tax=Streptosporangium sp. CA-135522 TaxID=3240072 RepID=UPI003D8C8220
MRTWVKGTTPAALLALGVMTLGSGTAFADTSGDHSIGGGNQVNVPITLPIDISGNSAAVAGESDAASTGGASVENAGGGTIPGETSGRGSVLGGNQVNAPIAAPINACGNAVAIFGGSEAGCKGGAAVKNTGKAGGGGNRTNGDHSVLGGNQVNVPITAPINACGNAVAIFGDAVAGCKGGAAVKNTGKGATGGNRTSGRSSVLGGNQVNAPITAPINICGNAVAVLGKAFAGCKGGAEVTDHGRSGKPGRPGKPGYPGGHGGWRPGSNGNDTDGRFGAGSGNQVIAPISLPVNVCGNAVGNASAGCKGGISLDRAEAGRGAGGNTTSGRSGVLAGNQVVAPITAPINVCGNAVALAGKAFAGCRGGVSVKNGGRGAGGNTTSGRSGVLAGNQVVAPITAPINVCGNAVAVLGDAAAGCLGGSRVGGPGGHGGQHGYGHWTRMAGNRNGGGLVPALPVVPALSGVGSDKVGQAHGSGLPRLPLVDEVQGMAGLPELPVVPGARTTAQDARRTSGSPLAPVTGLVSSTPIGGALPVGDLGLMSAAQPAGVTGMNSGSLFALLFGAMAAASAALFATTRRIRFGKK